MDSAVQTATKLLDGKLVSQIWQQELGTTLIGKTVAILQIGSSLESIAYIKMKERKAKELGVTVKHSQLITSSMAEITDVITAWNSDSSINGILLQLPLPDNLEIHRRQLLDTISPEKDVDCLTSTRLGLALTGCSFLPATAEGILKLLSYYQVPLQGQRVVCVGASLLVNKPLANRLENSGATVILCNKFTPHLEAITQTADILICAAGVPHIITAQSVKKGVVIIDAGFTSTSVGILGDVDFDSVEESASMVTPLPGGVGPMTVLGLFANLAKLTQQNLITNSLAAFN